MLLRAGVKAIWVGDFKVCAKPRSRKPGIAIEMNWLYYGCFLKIWLAGRRAEVSLAGLTIPLSNRKFSIELTDLSGGESSFYSLQVFTCELDQRSLAYSLIRS